MTAPRGRGRPTTGVKIQIRIPADTLAAIDAAAAELGMTRPAYIREVLEILGKFPPSSIDIG